MDTKSRSFFFMKMCLKFSRNYGCFLKYTFPFKTTNDKFDDNSLDERTIYSISIHKNSKEYRQQILLMLSIYHHDK